MSQVEAVNLANSVSACAFVLAGLLTIVLALTMTRQPVRWLAVYGCLLAAGIATTWYHVFGGTVPARVADIATSLLLVWMIQVAVVGDFYRSRRGRFLALVVGLVNLEYIVTFALNGGEDLTPVVPPFVGFAGFTFGESLLIINCVIAAALLFARRRAIHRSARPLLALTSLTFAAGLLLATGSNVRIGDDVVAFHAVWHVVGAFGFVALWAFNEVRFGVAEDAVEHPVGEAAEDEPMVEATEDFEESGEPLEDERPVGPIAFPPPGDREQVFAY